MIVQSFIKETTSTNGTGDITLSSVPGFARFLDAFPVDSVVSSVIRNGLNWEAGYYTIRSGNILERTTPVTTFYNGIYDSSSPSAITLVGNSDVFCDLIGAASASVDGYMPSSQVTSAVDDGTSFYVLSRNVGIGLNNPTQPFQIAFTNSTVPPSIDLYSNDAFSAGIFYRKARGTVISPSAVNTGDAIATIQARAYTGSQFISVGNLRFVATGTIGTASVPTRVDLRNANNSGVVTTHLSIDSAGNVTVPVGYFQPQSYVSQDGSAGLTIIVTTAALTLGGTQGSLTFKNGILTAQVQAT